MEQELLQAVCADGGRYVVAVLRDGRHAVLRDGEVLLSTNADRAGMDEAVAFYLRAIRLDPPTNPS